MPVHETDVPATVRLLLIAWRRYTDPLLIHLPHEYEHTCALRAVLRLIMLNSLLNGLSRTMSTQGSLLTEPALVLKTGEHQLKKLSRFAQPAPALLMAQARDQLRIVRA